MGSDGDDKPFCTKAITIIDNFENALGDTDNRHDKSQVLKAISVIDKLSPINFSDKCCSKLLMCLTKFFFLVSQITKVFFQIFQEKRAVPELCRGIKHNKERFFKLQQDLIDTANFAIAPTP